MASARPPAHSDASRRRRRLSGRHTAQPKRPALQSVENLATHPSATKANVLSHDDAMRKQKQAHARANASHRPPKPTTPPSPHVNNATKKKKATRTDEQLLNLYTECIKLASTNKINAKNTWQLQLIDYMDVVVVDSKEKNDMVNFQRASVTLDASVQIYSSRVDDVHKETYKVLGGLNRGKDFGPAHDEEEFDQGDEDDDDKAHAAAQRAKTRRARRAARGASATLATAAQLQAPDAHEAATFVDPLFQQMSAAFDEGGAHGLLLNRLVVHDGCTLAIDSHAVVPYPHEPKEIGPDTHATTVPALQTLFGQLFPANEDIAARMVDWPLCPALDTMYAEMNSIRHSEIHEAPDVAPEQPEFDFEMDLPPTGEDLQDLDAAIEHEQALQDNIHALLGDNDDADRDGDAPPVLFGNGAPHDTRRSVRSIDDLGFLERHASHGARAWAGMGHWKFGGAPTQGATRTTAAERAQKREDKRMAAFIDFFAEPVSPAEFDAPKRTNNTLSTQTLEAAQQDKYLLPEDTKFRARRLQAPFLKPHMVMRLPLGRRALATEPVGAGDYAAAFDVEGPDYDGPADEDVDFAADAAGGLAFFGDDDAEMEFVGAPDLVAKINIGYATVAKKVDVRALKHSMWHRLEDTCDVDDTKKEDKEEEEEEEEEEQAAVSFQDTIQAVAQDMPEDQRGNLSVSFCFICLLHLANEKELALQALPATAQEDAEAMKHCVSDAGVNLGDFVVSGKR